MSKYDAYGGPTRTPYDEGYPEEDQWEPDLDAYGHLDWTVGCEDWLWCCDFDISPDGKRYAYHVVVNCESGGFVGEVDSGEGPIEEIGKLAGLMSQGLELYFEGYAGDPGFSDPESDTYYHEEDNQRSIKRWRAAIAEAAL